MDDDFQTTYGERTTRAGIATVIATVSALAGAGAIWLGARPNGPVSAYAAGAVAFALGFAAMFAICSFTARRRLAAAELSREFADEALAKEVRQLSREIAVRKDMENALFAAMEAAEVANNTKSEFLANVTHELRTPMTAIISSTDLMLSSEQNPETRELLKIVKQSSESMMLLIGNLLDLAKGQAGSLELEHSSFNLREAIDAIARPFMPSVVDKGIRLSCNIDPNVPSVVIGDSRRLQQILGNLVDNAIKFTQKGYVKVTVLREPEDSDAKREYARLRFAVEDTGVGIPMNALHELFDAFTQADGSSTRPAGGTGLGLTVTRQLVEIMGGNISVESEEGVGSKFQFVMKFRLEGESGQSRLNKSPREPNFTGQASSHS